MSGWQTKFNVSPGPVLWSLVLGPFGPDLGPDLDLTWTWTWTWPGPELDLTWDLDLSLTIYECVFSKLSISVPAWLQRGSIVSSTITSQYIHQNINVLLSWLENLEGCSSVRSQIATAYIHNVSQVPWNILKVFKMLWTHLRKCCTNNMAASWLTPMSRCRTTMTIHMHTLQIKTHTKNCLCLWI